MTDRARSLQDEAWRRIEFEAHEQIVAEIIRDENTPPTFGQQIAWMTGLYGRSDTLSAVHRVGLPREDDPNTLYTACGEPIPAPSLWLALTPAFARSLGPCRYCAAEHVRMINTGAMPATLAPLELAS